MEAWARPRWEAAQWQPHEGPGARLTRPRQVRELLTEKLLEHHPQQRLRRPRLPDGKTCAAVGQPLLGRPHVLSHRHHADAHTITSQSPWVSFENWSLIKTEWRPKEA